MTEPLCKKPKVSPELENNPPEDSEMKETKVEEHFLEELKRVQDADANIDPTDDGSMFPFPEDDDASVMLEGVDLTNQWPSLTERYFTPFYKINVQKPGDDICIRVHTNRICILSLAPSHSIFQRNSQITKIDFRVSEKLDRTKNKVSGKGKHGAQPLQETSSICSISCADGETHVIKCCIIGKLVEVNESLATNPSLLREPPHKGGYLAIVLPNIKLIEEIKKKLLTQEDYDAALEERKAKLKLEELKEGLVPEIRVEG